MHLREVAINGFKSFADRTRVRLDTGVTCIVGPNGCGKSNIVDAIRWVLGEQSAKAMRSGKMSDVIFQGSDRRKPLPQCEVSLIFSDCEAELGTQFNEVEISRRVDREGGGDYFINGKRCRLKDIHQLFMDTGIGRAGYSFMMQGQIDQILSSNPQERRAIFEEAAGITRYKAQRKEALAKLALTDQNLQRITDVIEQMTRQINSLRRQASKALRFKRLKHRLTHLDLARFAFAYGQQTSELRELEGRFGELKSILDSCEAERTVAEEKLETLKAERTEALDALQTVQQQTFDLRSEKEAAGSRLRFASVRRDDLAGRIEKAVAERALLAAQLEEVRQRRDSTEIERTAAESIVSDTGETFRERSERFEKLSQSIAGIEREASQRRQRLQVLEASLSKLRSRVSAEELESRTFEVKQTGINDMLHGLNERLAGERQRHNELTTAGDHAREQVELESRRVEAAREAVQSSRSSFKAVQVQIQETDRRIAQLSARRSTLLDMQLRFEGFSSGAKAILQGQLKDALNERSVRPLSAVIEADPRFASAVESLMGQDSEAILLDDAVEAVLPVFEALDAGGHGRACLQVSVVRPRYESGLGPSELPQWLIPAHRVVSSREPELAELVGSLFEGCYFCEQLSDFLDFWKANPGFNFLFVATLADEIVSHRGLLYGGRKRSSGASFLQRAQQIDALKSEIAEANEQLTTFHESADEANRAIETAEAALEAIRNEHHEAVGAQNSINQDLKSVSRSIAETEREIRARELERSKLEEGRGNSVARLQAARAELDSTERDIAGIGNTVQQSSGQLDELYAQRDALRESLTEAKLALAEKRQQLELVSRGIREAASREADLRQRIEVLEKSADEMRGQVGDLGSETERERSRLVALETELADAGASLEAARERMARADDAIGEVEGELSELRRASQQRARQASDIEVRLAEKRSQARFIEEKVRSEYEREVADVRWKQQLWLADETFETRVDLGDLDSDDEGEPLLRKRHDRAEPTGDDLRALDQTDWAAVETECGELRRRIQSLGAINLVAIEEYGELKEQYEFRKTQSDDIWRAKEALLKTIDELNETSQRLFAETFEAVKKNFSYTFEKLFGGGTGDLQLITAEDVLDSGIEIVARPPGTKLRNLTLLSGGQRTMTAVALLFAIYMVKPSPFAVLDELDAPLDDINVGRFCDIVKEFVQYSQFLIVTHNKRTMAAADAIFGVTMEERGVTKLVSMKFRQDSTVPASTVG